MDRRAMEAQLRDIERRLGAEEVSIHGDDGQVLRLAPAAALEIFLDVLDGASDEPSTLLPAALLEWIREHGQEGSHDITATIVRTYRRQATGKETST